MGGYQRDDELVQALELAVQELRAPPQLPQRDADGVLTLTAAGQDIINKMTTVRMQLLEEQLKGWDPEHHEELIALLKTLADNSLDAPDASLMRR